MKLSERAAVTLLFFLNGVIFSSFFARLPAIKADLGASDGELGVALFFATLGLVVAQPLAGALAARAGARAPCLGGLAFYALGLPVAAAAPSVPALAVVLFGMGLANGVLDVAMNVEGVAVERRRGRRVLSSMHAAFSFGGMTGAGLGGLAAAAGLDAEVHLSLVAALALAGGLVAATGLPAPRPDRPRGRPFVRPDRRLALLGAVAFCVLLAEGSVTDWSAVYLNEGAGASEGAGRGRPGGVLAGDGAGPAGGRRGGRALGCARGHPGRDPAGRGRPGPGPGGGRARGRDRGLRPDGHRACRPVSRWWWRPRRAARGDAEAASIALVSGAGYVGLTAGPATIGLLSDAAGLRQALVLVVVLALVAATLAGAARRGDGRAAS